MEKDVKEAWAAIGVIFTALILIFLMPVLGVLIGAFSGWVVGLFFTETIMTTIAGFGFSASVSMWELGATLGFIGGFFRVTRRNISVNGK